MTIITKQSEIAAASTADLVATYNKLEGKSIKKFENRAIAESRVSMAILAAENRAGHKGVAKGAKPDAANGAAKAERSAKGADAGRRSALADVAGSLTKEQIKLSEAKRPVGRPASEMTVRATFAGVSKPQAGSTRNAVLEAIQKAPDHTISVAALSKKMKCDCRGYVHKLMEKKHLVAVDA